jgi:hypothetical protein
MSGGGDERRAEESVLQAWATSAATGLPAHGQRARERLGHRADLEERILGEALRRAGLAAAREALVALVVEHDRAHAARMVSTKFWTMLCSLPLVGVVGHVSAYAVEEAINRASSVVRMLRERRPRRVFRRVRLGAEKAQFGEYRPRFSDGRDVRS